MAKKKAPWRQGIVVSHEGQRDEPATEKLALRYLHMAALERDPGQEIKRLKQAKVVAMLGRMNERLVDLSTYKPGRPKGSRLSTLDAPLRSSMEAMAAETGEIRPYRLARLAVEANEINDDLREAAIRRLVRWWHRQDRQK